MIISEGYSILQDTQNNRIIISLPQTNETLQTTVTPIKQRRLTITGEEETLILLMVKQLYERGEVEK